MIGLFRRSTKESAAGLSALGAGVVALRLPPGASVPGGCVGVVVDGGGRTRRTSAASRVAPAALEALYCFHPGPYAADLVPFAAAPEIGLRIAFAVDSVDPRVTQQRFDLYLASEADERIELAALSLQIEAALQRELAQGNLELPPCTTLEEWNAFRAGLNQLLYTRFGLAVDDCVPVDLGQANDYAGMLAARSLLTAQAQIVAAAAPLQAPFDPACADRHALRRLFLELPCVMCALRQAVLPRGQELFHQHQALLQRLDLVSLSVGTMPTLALAAPGQTLAANEQARRARHSVRAVAALDEAWALLARLARAEEARLPALFDEADRIIANLENDSAARRLSTLQGEAR
jgi:hypothetical protein